MPTLRMMTEFAVAYMEKHFPDGYFLMVEGAYIDKKSHENNINYMMEHLDNFDVTIGWVRRTVKDASIIVTADHETGGLQRALTYDALGNQLFTTKDHTPANIPCFISLRDRTGRPIPYRFPALMDNTDIFAVCRALLTR